MRHVLGVILLLLGVVSCTSSPHQPTLRHLYDYQLHTPSGESIALESLVSALVSADVILVGEWHTHAGIHLFQADLLDALHRQRTVALSMEQFSRDGQAVVQAYLDGDIGEQPLINQANAWPNYESDYRPLIEIAKQQGIDVIAANAPRSIVRCIGRQGLDYLTQLDAVERAYVADALFTDDSPYKSKFMRSMHHGAAEQNERLFAAQMAWDETMAESIVQYITQHPNTQVMHIAGAFHTEAGLGTAAAILRRIPALKVAIITPVTDVSLNSSDYQLLVLPLPTRYVQEANRMQAYHGLSKRNDDLVCQ